MRIASKDLSATQLVREALDKAHAYQGEYHIFNWINDNAIKRAEEIDARIAAGEEVGRLAGVPYALKDNFLSTEGPSTASAKILENLESPIVATTVEKLESEGAICIGRTNLDAFAHGSSTENSYFGPTKNSKDTTRVAGGSSGGSAVAVALDIVQFATGTDTGGSIRQPASLNGVYGFKPTYGTISRYGVVAMTSSVDCIGFFAQSANDIDLLMDVCAGPDAKDMTTLPDYYHEDVADVDPVKRIGIIKDFDNEKVGPAIREALHKKVQELKDRGHEIVELEMPTLKYALPTYYIITPAEVASNLSRYDGIRYGWRDETAQNLEEIYDKTRDQGFMPENKRRIMIGNFVLSSGFYDAYYLKAAKVRTLIIEEYNKAFEKCDFILAPAGPDVAFKLGAKVNDPIAMYLEDVMTVPLNLAGIPGLSIPVGQTEDGLDIGLQLVGPRRSDKKLLKFAGEIMGSEPVEDESLDINGEIKEDA